MFLFDTLTHPLALALAEQARAAGHRVEDASALGGLEPALAQLGAPQAVVFAPPAECEAKGLGRALSDPAQAVAFAAALRDQAMDFLRNCRAATLAMMPQKAGQVLYLGVDDVAARIMGLTETPMASQMRIAALKSLAKEYGRMGLQYNTVICQPSRDLAEADVWRARREAMKVYTMRFSPSETAEQAAFCMQVLTGKVPLNGGVICLGKGVMEMAA